MMLSKIAVREREDGGISITEFHSSDMQKYGYTDEIQFISWYMELRFKGQPYILLSRTDIPKTEDGKIDRSKRDKWRIKNGKIHVNNSIKTKEEKLNENKSVIKQKLVSGEPLSQEEAEAILGGK